MTCLCSHTIYIYIFVCNRIDLFSRVCGFLIFYISFLHDVYLFSRDFKIWHLVFRDISPPPRAPNIFAYSAYVYLFSHVMFCIHIFTDFHSLYIFINFYIWFLHCSPTGNECFLVVVVVYICIFYISVFRRCFSFLVWFSFHMWFLSFLSFVQIGHRYANGVNFLSKRIAECRFETESV